MVIDKRLNGAVTDTETPDIENIIGVPEDNGLKVSKMEYNRMVRQSERLRVLQDILRAEMEDTDKIAALAAVILYGGEALKAGGKS